MTSNQDPVDDQREDQGTSQPVVESTVKRSRDDQREDQRTSHPVVESTVKRSRVVDPDYEEISDQPSKRQRVLEEDAKEATKRKIERIIQSHFVQEIHNKQSEINVIDQRLNQAQVMMDRLRACIIANFYTTPSQHSQSKINKQFWPEIPSIHPAVRRHLGKAPLSTVQNDLSQDSHSQDNLAQKDLSQDNHSQKDLLQDSRSQKDLAQKDLTQNNLAQKDLSQNNLAQKDLSQNNLSDNMSSTGETTLTAGQATAAGLTVNHEATASSAHSSREENKSKISPSVLTRGTSEAKRGSRFKIKKTIIVGNLSKFIPVEGRDVNDMATHKWMLYVRGPQDQPKIDGFVKKVWFFLHPSYRPNDLVEISQPPFHLTRRGWGEFPVRVQLYFRDVRNKRVDIIHQLVLDKTCTGLQTLGSETVVEIELEKEETDERLSDPLKTAVPTENKNKTKRRQKHSSTKCFTKGDNSEVSGIKQEPLLDSVTIETRPQENVKVKVENLSQEELADSMLTLSANRGRLESGAVCDGGETSVSDDTKPASVSDANIVQKDVQNSSAISANPSHRKRIKLKENHGEADILCGSVVNSSTVDAGSSCPLLENGQRTHTPAPANLNNNHNAALCLVNSQGKRLPHSKDVKAKSNTPKVSLVTQTGALSSPTSQMYIKSTDSKGNVILQLVGQRSPVVNNSDKLPAVKMGQVSLLDGKKKSGLSGEMHSGRHVVSSVVPLSLISTGDRSSGSCSLSNKLSKPLIYSLSPSTQTAASCAKTSSVTVSSNSGSAPQSDIHSIHKSEAPVSVINSTQCIGAPQISVNSTQCIGAPQIGVNSTQFIAAPQISVNSTQCIGAPQISVNSTQCIGAPQISVNSTQCIGAPQIGVNSTQCIGAPQISVNSTLTNGTRVSGVDVAASAVQNVRLVVTPQGLRLIPIGEQGKDDVCTLVSNALVRDRAQNKPSPGGVSSALSATKLNTVSHKESKVTNSCPAPQLMLANIGVQTFVLKVLPNTNPSTSSTTATQLSSNLHEHSLVSSVLGQPAAALQANTVTTNTLPVGLSVCNRTSPGSSSNPSTNQHSAVSVSSANRSESYMKSLLTLPYSHEEKKLLVLRKDKDREKDMREEIPYLKVANYVDMLSLVRAGVRRHPVVRDPPGQVTHPYCAKSVDDWLRWNIGKRRASEWQRASSVRRYIATHLLDGCSFKGEQLWTTKQIMTWCRFHAYSPHYLEKHFLLNSGCSKGERTLASSNNEIDDVSSNWKQSNTLSEPGPLVSMVIATTNSDEDTSSSDEEIDILSVDEPKVKGRLEVKKEPESVPSSDPEYLSPSDQAVFVQETVQKIGVSLQPTEIEEGVFGAACEELIFGVMKCFMEDVLRQAFQCNMNKNRSVDMISVQDVQEALSTLRHADFVTSKHMGVREEQTNTDIS